MYASREWVPPKRNTEDPSTPPLPGMPELKAPRITPHHRLYHQADNREVWGALAHPDLQEHNPFLRELDRDYMPGRDDPASQWRQDYGGWEDHGDDEDKMDPEALRKHVQSAFDKASPALAIDTHPLHQVLNSGRVKTQFETHTSGGSLAPESRQDLEHKLFGYPHDLPAHARPVYGYLTHDPSQHHPAASGYGNHVLVLHRPRIWHRTSAFLGDSLDDQGGGHSAHPVQDFQASGFPHYADPKQWRLDDMDPEGNISYTEAQYHGGVGLRDIHYAVLHPPRESAARWDEHGVKRYHALKDKLNQHKIPWVEMDHHGVRPSQWEHHLSRLMHNAARGAHMHSDQSRVIGQQGKGRYLIDLGYDNENGHRQAQIADMNTGELHPPMPKDSILARGYWDEPDFPVDVRDVLPHVNPV